MSPITVTKTQPSASTVAKGGLRKLLETSGRMPPVSLLLKPLDGSGNIALERFLNYRFSSSMLVPVDTFSFNFVAPDDSAPLPRRIKDGDIAVLQAAGQPLATGIVDTVDVETDADFGETGAIMGRDLLSQFEDQDAISIDDKPIWANQITVNQAARRLAVNTRISKFEMRNAPTGSYLLATEPQESKLAALQRFLEPLNCLAWMSPTGTLVIGRPNFSQAARGTVFLSKERRDSNALSMKVSRSSTNIPNIMLPIWAGQETVQDRVSPEQRLYNAAQGPTRLRKYGHRVPKSVVVSTPQGSSAQDLSEINRIQAGGANLLQAHAKREIARANVREILVQAVMPGHYNDEGEPFQVDTVYRVIYDRGDVDELMYLFAVEYELSEEKGQISRLSFCRLGCIVSDVVAR